MNKNHIILITTMTLFSACAALGPRPILEEVGPTETVYPSTGNGTLVVYTPWDVHADPGETDPYGHKFDDYKIFNPNGALIKTVSVTDEAAGPAEVQLSPGRYSIRARANGYGTVTVPALLVSDHLTEIHLEGGYRWPGATKHGTPVKLPDGEIIGWQNK